MHETTDKIFDGGQEPGVETWLVGIERLQSWVHPPEGRPFRRPFAVCLNLDREESLCLSPEEQDATALRQLRLLLRQAARYWRGLPARVQTDQPAVAAVLEEILAGEGIAVEVEPDLPRLRKSLASHAFRFEPEEEEEETAVPSLLAGPGVTLAQIAAFARAAVDFLAREPWRLLGAEDLVRVDTPEAEPELRHAVLSTNQDGPVLHFLETPEELEWLDEWPEDLWSIAFPPVWKAPTVDADLWERHGLSRFGEEERIASPFFVLSDSGFAERPGARQLAFFEGLLKALAASTEAEMEGGRWVQEVETHLGPLRFSLSLPRLLAVAARDEPPPAPLPEPLPEEMREEAERWLREGGEEVAAWLASFEEEPEEDWASCGPAERVRRLLDAAVDWGGRCQVLLARRALEIQPDCAEAWVRLAEMAPTAEQGLELYHRAWELAEQSLGPEALREGELDWSHPGVESLLLARREMAHGLQSLGRLEEAASHLEALLRLEPDDSLLRNELAALQIERGREEEALALFEPPEADRLPGGAFNRALLIFRREGDSPEARRALRAALRKNPAVPDFLLPRRRRDELSFGDWEIAAHSYGSTARPLWKQTPGALTWLARNSRDSEPPRPAGAHPALSPARKKKKRRQRRKGKKRR